MAWRSAFPTREAPSLSHTLLAQVLPAEYVDTVHHHLFDPQSPLQIVQRNVWATTQTAWDLAWPVVRPVVGAGGAYLAAHPEVSGTAVLVLTVVAALLVLRWVQRVIAFWLRLGAGIVFWGLVGLGVAMVWQVGLQRSAWAVFASAGRLFGYAQGVKDVWASEYKRYEAQQYQRQGRHR